MYKKEVCHMPYTIESQLKEYATCSDHMERHEILWHEWNHNKRWLIQLQQMIMPSFPSYSRHDDSHSQAVLHNIEMILGEENIKSLSATDCFLILHAVYVHDIGMCITHEEQKAILKDTKFHAFLKEQLNSEDSEMSTYAKLLLQECFHSGIENENEKTQYILNAKLDVYYAVIYLIGDFRRKEHGDVSKNRLIHWMDKPDKLGLGFSSIEVPERLFYIVANCAATHTKWDFGEVLKLNQEDSGFVLDYAHPRFIAVLLQLGDALDMDNDRFHPLTKEYLGNMPEFSERHYQKHKAIRRLRITNQKISIMADCNSQEVLRLIRSECDGIEQILKNATFYWAVIKPRESNMCLPTFDKKELLYKGKEIPSELVDTRFEISQEKAFHLLKGNNIYTEEHFVFLRELLQNAIDATKIQYFRECNRKLQKKQYLKEEEKEKFFLNPYNISKIISPNEFPVDIQLCIKKWKKDKCEDITEEDLRNLKQVSDEYDFGVQVKISDCGTGISAEDIKQIANVGTTINSKREEINEMPSWLRPTGTFGIGLQSVFLSSDRLKASTYSVNGEPYEIVFHPRNQEKNGYINVSPIEKDNNKIPFGSCFEVFVSYTKKKSHKDSPDTWDGRDPFTKNYDESKPIRHSQELLKQMSLYLCNMVGEQLFSVNLYISDPIKEKFDSVFDVKADPYGGEFREMLDAGNMSVHYVEKMTYKEKANGNDYLSKLTWAYGLNEDIQFHEADNGDLYGLDYKNAKLHIWNQECGAYACIGGQRIFAIRRNLQSQEGEQTDSRVKVYYKGVHVTQIEFKEDANLIEYIDLKQTLDSKYLKLSRNGFSEEGYEYFEEIYHKIIKTARHALDYFGSCKSDGNKTSTEGIIEALKELSDSQKYDRWEEVALSATALACFAMVREKDYVDNAAVNHGWNEMLEKIKENHGQIIIDQSLKKLSLKDSTLYNIPCMYWNCLTNIKESITIYDVISEGNKYAMVSKREDNNWVQYLVQCNKFHANIKSKIIELKRITNMTEREKKIVEIDECADKLLYDNFFEDDKFKLSKTKKEQVIFKWFLDNFPTIAIFASRDGNTRVNFLDSEIPNSIYFCQNMKYLTMNRIFATQSDVQRFSIPVWSGYELLALDEARKSVLLVKRGKFPKMRYGEIILPSTKEDLEKVKDSYSNGIEEMKSLFLKIYENAILGFVRYLSNRDNKEQYFTRFLSKLEEMCKLDITNIGLPMIASQEILDEDNKEEYLANNYYYEILESLKAEKIDSIMKDEPAGDNTLKDNSNVDKKCPVWEKKVVPEVNFLMKFWYLTEIEADSFLATIELEGGACDESGKEPEANKYLLEYVMEHAKQKTTEKHVKFLYRLLWHEIQNSIKKYESYDLFGDCNQKENEKAKSGFLEIYRKLKERAEKKAMAVTEEATEVRGESLEKVEQKADEAIK